jgi:uridine monophosphate synthetase
MTSPFFKRLEERIISVNSLLCVGLDPHPEFLPQKNAAGARDFCFRIIEQTAEVACAFKPNSAFFEAFGAEGFKVLGDVIGAVPDGIPVILDAKRGDIASTAKAYANAACAWCGCADNKSLFGLGFSRANDCEPGPCMFLIMQNLKPRLR